MTDTAIPLFPDEIKLVRQSHSDGCGIATVAMITGVSYPEVWDRLAPPPTELALMSDYHARETAFLKEKGWWPSAQLNLRNTDNLKRICTIIDNNEQLKKAVETSQRLRIVLTFADGEKLNHVVVWDRTREDVIFDPSRGLVPVSELFNDAGPQTYSGTLGFTAFCYRPKQPIEPLVINETDDATPATATILT